MALSAGFNISLEPGFSITRLCFILAYGGVYAVANLRYAMLRPFFAYSNKI